jgi:hypothetical protein
MGYNLSHRFVIRNYPRWWGINSKPDGFSIHLNTVPELNTLPNMGRFIVDRNPAFHDELFHFQSGPHTSLRQDFVEFGRFCHGCQDPFGWSQFHQILISVKLTGNYINKSIMRAWSSSDLHLCI